MRWMLILMIMVVVVVFVVVVVAMVDLWRSEACFFYKSMM